VSDYLLSVVLGIVEGVTEFLPVSSTAHLRISEALFHIDLSDGFWILYSIVIQLGAVLCLPVYFAPRIARFLATFPAGERGDGTWLTHPLSLTAIAFVVTAVPSFLATRLIGANLESLTVMGASLLVGGIVMWIVDAIYERTGDRRPPGSAPAERTRSMDDMSVLQAVWIGACQVLSAVFPGTSRSMATIAAGQVAGLTRESALEFSFFLSIPVMFAATGYALLKSVRGDAANPLGVAHINAHQWVVLAIGGVVSFIVAYVSVAWFMNYVRTRGFWPFAIYRIIVGAGVLLWAARVS
jgi:undecaprenyl-diphosphatase